MNKKIFYIVFFLLFIANYSHLNANILENKKRIPITFLIIYLAVFLCKKMIQEKLIIFSKILKI